jgi:hypothetical protein
LARKLVQVLIDGTQAPQSIAACQNGVSNEHLFGGGGGEGIRRKD